MVGGLLHGGGWLLLILMMMMRVPVIISEDLWHNVRQYANERERGLGEKDIGMIGLVKLERKLVRVFNGTWCT